MSQFEVLSVDQRGFSRTYSTNSFRFALQYYNVVLEECDYTLLLFLQNGRVIGQHNQKCVQKSPVTIVPDELDLLMVITNIDTIIQIDNIEVPPKVGQLINNLPDYRVTDFTNFYEQTKHRLSARFDIVLPLQSYKDMYDGVVPVSIWYDPDYEDYSLIEHLLRDGFVRLKRHAIIQ